MKHTTCIFLLSALLLPAKAQSVAENRAYLRVGAAGSQNDLKAYLGDRAFNPIYEVGYNFHGPTETTGLAVYGSYLAAHGNPIVKYGGLKQALFSYRLGVDLHFRTPIKGFAPFAGFNVNWFDGLITQSGLVQDNQNKNNQFLILAGAWPEGQAKLGFRFGAEYRITKNWGVSIDNSITHWLSKSNDGNSGQASLTGARYYKGINPVAPTWLNIAVQYRWKIWE